MTGPIAPHAGPTEDLWCELAGDPPPAAAPDLLWCDLADEETG